ncbi:arrestin domain-containing protein 3-like [Toxorhynchites rutilus septentrionalis]|uniref:arrestin domain-containing protein 3-like n=1 Tax=Toxorhynchites rutilus septentrionalis TaxID=329112 RepID=UPI00247A74B8|nr:arrestin domain-containing protein 3-like [Toxorhynchites rutilus septentrionalis]
MSIGCEIKFDENPYGVYFPGQTLAGTVELRLAEVTKVKGVALKISGVAEVKWSETTGTGKTRRTIYYHGRQDYLHSTTYLAGSKEGNTLELLPGIHTYRFSCVLPPNLITSLEADHGHVRYTVKVVLERSWKFEKSYKVAFTVLRHVNLNEELFEIRFPSKMEKAKTFCCGPCRSDPMHITAEIPISGYVPGQTIAVKIDVNNQSRKNMDELSTKLVQIVSFISQTPRCQVKAVSSVIAEARCAGVNGQNKQTYEQHLLIPPMPPTSRSCQVLTINYCVEVEGKISGLGINPRIQIPVTLGTIPLSVRAIPAFGNAMFTTPVLHQPTSAAPEGTVPIEPRIPAELPPPSYEEVISASQTDIQDEGETNEIGWRNYTPRYMVYRFEGSQPEGGSGALTSEK